MREQSSSPSGQSDTENFTVDSNVVPSSFILCTYMEDFPMLFPFSDGWVANLSIAGFIFWLTDVLNYLCSSDTNGIVLILSELLKYVSQMGSLILFFK